MTSGDWWFNPPALLVESQFFITMFIPVFWRNPHVNSPWFPEQLIHPLAPSLYLISMSVIGYPAPIFLGEIPQGSQHVGTQKTSQDSLSVKNRGFIFFPIATQ